MKKRLKTILLGTAAGRALLMPFRFWLALSYSAPQLRRVLAWVFVSHELSNFTYGLTANNRRYLAHTISTVANCPLSRVLGYFEEIEHDEQLKTHIRSRISASPLRYSCDAEPMFGRRLGWYAFARVLKPKVVVETGVDKGLGSIVLCAALLQNEREGFPGEYFGTDINPRAGLFLAQPYSRVGRILYGDSLQSLAAIPRIDLFINDSDHSAEYEQREYEAIASKLQPRGLILGDNAHATDVLARFSEASGRKFVFFREQPHRHWYPGAGIGISFGS
jgi:predicted O-methyltransferase YrrM